MSVSGVQIPHLPQKNKYMLHYIDLFCGAGGTTTGVEQAHIDNIKCADVIACVNHEPHAIASHLANHPHAQHFIEDIRTLDVAPLDKLCRKVRKAHPHDYIVLWASLECTNFSRAKGGQPRDADSRTLAEHLFRYIEAIKPDFIQIENVEEFMCWGDLDSKGRPVSKDRGRCYLKWIKDVKKYGYDFEYRLLNAADFGAYTSRRRYFGLFAKHGLPIAFPHQTYGKYGDEGGLFHQYRKWKPVREVLDVEDEGESIFGRKKPLCEKTLERIFAGLVKFVAGGKAQYSTWLLKYNSTNKQGHHNAPSIDEPCPTVVCQNRLGVVKCQFCQDRMELITSRFIDNQYGNGTPSSIESPGTTISTKPKQQLVTVKPWLMDTSFNNTAKSIDEPMPVITANRKWHYLMNPQFASAGGSIDKPCFTLIARMDKMPPYLMSMESGEIAVVVYETDSPMMRKLKEFMAAYGIVDIKMRMLKIDELKRIQGFPTDYVLVGSQAEQKKFIGNAVEVGMSRALCEALYQALNRTRVAL